MPVYPTHRRRTLLVLLLGVFMIGAAYVGSYYLLVQHRPELSAVESGDPLAMQVETTVEIEPYYSSPSPWLATFYAPLHRLDRWLRPSYWQTRKIVEIRS